MSKKKKSRLINIILVAFLLVGLSLLLYPSISDYWNSFHQTRAIMTYMENVNSMDTTEYDKIIASARAYNESINDGEFHWFLSEEDKEVYNAELAFNSTGVMGYITIDKIQVSLPIYHGVSEAVLQTSIGHIDWTSLPVGGEGSHCALSGHRGLPSAKLFSDLDKLIEGDTFTLSILNETLTYEVDQIRVVEPANVNDLQIVPGMDYCTLVTCTPYGVNSHRLLVRGHRIGNAQGDARVTSDAMLINKIYVVPFIGVPILLLLLVMLFFSTGKYARHRDSYSEIRDWEEQYRREDASAAAKAVAESGHPADQSGPPSDESETAPPADL